VAPLAASVAPSAAGMALERLKELAGLAGGGGLLDGGPLLPVRVLAVGVPIIDAVVRQLRLLDAWRERLARAEQEASAARQHLASSRLAESSRRAQLRIAAAGFDVAAAAHGLHPQLEPAAFERRVAWSEYREAERAASMCRRRAERQLVQRQNALASRSAAVPLG
ncbi:unnamed protein product, partial [Polarella glacialis]